VAEDRAHVQVAPHPVAYADDYDPVPGVIGLPPWGWLVRPGGDINAPGSIDSAIARMRAAVQALRDARRLRPADQPAAELCRQRREIAHRRLGPLSRATPKSSGSSSSAAAATPGGTSSSRPACPGFGSA